MHKELEDLRHPKLGEIILGATVTAVETWPLGGLQRCAKETRYRQNSLIRYRVYNDSFGITIYTPQSSLFWCN